MCVNARAELEWTVTPPGGPDCTLRYDGNNNEEGVVTTLCDSHTVVLDAVGPNQLGILTYNSSLNVTLEKNVTVKCASSREPEIAILTVASK